MKKAFVLMILFGSIGFAQQVADKANDFCDTLHAVRPGSSDPVEAAGVLGIEMQVSSCALRPVLHLTSRQSLYMQSYDREKSEFRLKVIDFAKSPPTEKTCTAVSHMEAVPGGSWDARKEVFAPPTCTQETIAN